ncbi:HTH-type transcriptional regulator DmlR [Vibrio stylophorae]|uniref:HTH-type transcriptional regulator DmlR n=1 Tax=Vibrio stylophorae TaxID=659351 RepID=A0ABM8ZTB6_9VIBR|nr:LysR family transcriptional regulator [Vibrio stylophorae]CAH0533559.1 HTH-type transcriptional regulator DmlR [Vibrio stylophorae]
MQLDDLVIIEKVAHFGSITAAANHLDMRVATASAAVKRVEAHLGCELFVRSTRKLRLSIEGERFLPQCQQALALLEQAKANINQDQQKIQGELRLSLSSDLGRNVVLPWLDEMLDAHPELSLKVNIGDRNVDFYRDGIDVALRYGSPSDASLYGFKICDAPRVICASPAYLEKYARPQHPQDLAMHNGLFYQISDMVHDVWHFSKGDQPFKVKMQGNRASNDADLVRRWCVAGMGVVTKSCLDMAADLLAGRVVSLLPEYRAEDTELWLVCPSRQSITPAIRLLRDKLRLECQQLLSQLIAAGHLIQRD